MAVPPIHVLPSPPPCQLLLPLTCNIWHVRERHSFAGTGRFVGGFVSSRNEFPTGTWLSESIEAILSPGTKLKYIVYTHSHWVRDSSIELWRTRRFARSSSTKPYLFRTSCCVGYYCNSKHGHINVAFSFREGNYYFAAVQPTYARKRLMLSILLVDQIQIQHKLVISSTIAGYYRRQVRVSSFSDYTCRCLSWQDHVGGAGFVYDYFAKDSPTIIASKRIRADLKTKDSRDPTTIFGKCY